MKTLVIFCKATKGTQCVCWKEENLNNFGPMYELAAPQSVGKMTTSFWLYVGVCAYNRSRGRGSCGSINPNWDSAPVWNIRFLGAWDWSHLASTEPAGHGNHVWPPGTQQWERGQMQVPPCPWEGVQGRNTRFRCRAQVGAHDSSNQDKWYFNT